MILLDLNVVLDVLQAREPHYRASATVLERVMQRRVEAVMAGHALTTVHYLVARYRDLKAAQDAVDLLLRHFAIASVGREQLLRARNLGWFDFEDAVVAAAAESAGCSHIVSRNIRDFADSPVRAVTPEEYLLSIAPG